MSWGAGHHGDVLAEHTDGDRSTRRMAPCSSTLEGDGCGAPPTPAPFLHRCNIPGISGRDLETARPPTRAALQRETLKTREPIARRPHQV